MSYSSSSKSYNTFKSTNSSGFETSELTRGLSPTYSRRHYSHRGGPFERCQTLINMLISKKTIMMGQIGTGVTHGGRRVIIARTYEYVGPHPRFWREVYRYWALLFKAVFVHTIQYIGSHSLLGKRAAKGTS